jgi:hypothetical protein
LAVVLALALLSGIVPLNALSSSSHECNMNCCLGKSSHAAGSCEVVFASDEKAATPDESDHEQRSHRDAGYSSQKDASHDRHHAAKQPSAHHSSTDRATPQSVSVRAPVLTRPCAQECATAATSASTQTRRQRDPAAQTIAGKSRPQILTFRARDFSSKWSSSAGSHRLLPPRAPPILLLNLST